MKKPKITHKNKLRMARRMMTQEEIKNHVSPWKSIAWMTNKLLKMVETKDQKGGE